MSSKCSVCNNDLAPDAVFCDNCGTRQTPAAPPQQPPQPVYQPPQPAWQPPAQPSYQPDPQPWQPQSPPPAARASSCPNCSSVTMAGELFCANCGFSLQAAPVPAPAAAPAPAPAPTPAPAPNYFPPPTPAPAAAACTTCGSPLAPDMRFCDNCGTLVPARPPAPQGDGGQAADRTPDNSYQPPPPPFAPRLIVQSSGRALTLNPQTAQQIIGREDVLSNHFPAIDLGPHGGEEGGVSRNHATLYLEGERAYIQDNGSVNGTYVNRVKLQPNLRQPLNDGDELRFGRIVLRYKTS